MIYTLESIINSPLSLSLLKLLSLSLLLSPKFFHNKSYDSNQRNPKLSSLCLDPYTSKKSLYFFGRFGRHKNLSSFLFSPFFLPFFFRTCCSPPSFNEHLFLLNDIPWWFLVRKTFTFTRKDFLSFQLSHLENLSL